MSGRDLTGWWRHAAIAGLAAGLLASPALPAPAGWAPCALAGAVALAVTSRRRWGARPATSVALGSLGAAALLAALAGLGLGDARLAAIDAGALRAAPGQRLELTGWVTAQPRRSFGEVRVQVDTDDGRLVVVAPEPVPDLAVGQAVSARGVLREPDDFRAAELARAGAALELATERIRPVPGSRAGLAGAIDGIRSRAEVALGAGLDPEAEALARGFVLGQDDRIDPLVREQFRRAGLSHLLAVSGQNVVLLAILAGAGLALFGIGLRGRLVATVLIIALYVPVAGAEPSIQRAGAMGAAAILATLAGRLSGRAYPPLLAAAATLLVNPRFGSDVGWQLSFAAVAGIMLWARPAHGLIAERLPARLPEPLSRALADGAAMTLAATVATAPLIADDFERISLASIPANLLVLPAVAPVMWIGMLSGLLGQVPGVPTAPLGAVEGVLVDWIALVARVMGSPGWAETEVAAGGPVSVAVTYLGASAAVTVVLAVMRRRRRLAFAPAARVLAAGAVLAVLAFGLLTGSSGARTAADGLRITALDVGQGDATLLERPRGAPVLIDAGPPGGAAVAALDRLGVGSLAAVFVTHDQLDHAGGLREVLATHRVDMVIRGRPAPAVDAAARAAGARVVSVSEGSAIRFGALRIDVLWPPRGAADPDPNAGSLVLAAGWRGWDVLLTGDAEAEATHLVPGPFDVLKVAHHGSDDAGLGPLLDRSVPRVALIEVGADNSYGHPTAATLTTLAEHGVCILRTDVDGDATVELGPGGIAVDTARGAGTVGRAGCAPGR